jgi:3-isopropylmalate/(R)-2-methylmalate dehydratase large subunit
MSLVLRILSSHTKREVGVGEFIEIEPDIILGNDITFPIAIEEFERSGAKRVRFRERVFMVLDHFTPPKDIKSANLCQRVRDFAKRYDLPNLYDSVGIEHVLLPDEGMVVPGDVVVGADSHTCTYGALGALSTGVGSTDLAYAMLTGECWLRIPETIRFIYYGRPKRWVCGKDLILHTIADIGVDGANYKAMEFSGETLSHLGMSDRFTMCNMAVEAGGMFGYVEPDDVTIRYIETRARRPYRLYKGDGGEYIDVREYDTSKIEPQVAPPPLPSNSVGISEIGEVEIDQAFIGSCTNGRIEDLRMAADILKGRKIKRGVRLLVIPATNRVYREALREGLIDIFIEAGGIVCPPTCGPCLGGHMGVLGEGERAVATTNRNFIGRMGHPSSEVYLANPAVVAASSILGRIASPEEILGEDQG